MAFLAVAFKCGELLAARPTAPSDLAAVVATATATATYAAGTAAATHIVESSRIGTHSNNLKLGFGLFGYTQEGKQSNSP